jgi:hypothetical protein
MGVMTCHRHQAAYFDSPLKRYTSQVGQQGKILINANLDAVAISAGLNIMEGSKDFIDCISKINHA